MKKIMVFFLLFGWIAHSPQSFGQESFSTFDGCGEYTIGGVFENKKTHVELVILKDSLSEQRLKVTPASEPVGAAYFFNKPVIVTGRILKKMDGPKGEINLLSCKESFQDLLHPTTREGYILKQRIKCEK